MKSLTRGHLKAGLDSIRGSKWRNFWTMLGVIIGVASVIAVVSIGEGVKQQVGGQLRSLGPYTVTIRPTPLGTTGNGAVPGLISGLNVNGSLTPTDYHKISKLPSVSESAPLSLVPGDIKGELGAYNDGVVIGTTPDFESLIRHSVAFGSFLTDDDMGENTAVIGQHAADMLFNASVPLGRTFTFHEQQFVVRGVFSNFSTAPLSQQADFNAAIFIPYDVAQQLTNKTAPTYEILARARTHTTPSLDQTVSDIKKVVVGNHGGTQGVSVLRQQEASTGDSAVLDLLTRMIAGIAAISLLVGGIGIMNVMLVSVAERMHEIGIRKAVGATNAQILSQFMIEATFLSLAGGLIGIAVAFFADATLRAWTHLQPVITWQIVVVATVVSLLVGIIFGSIPALKAARKDPIDALRSE